MTLRLAMREESTHKTSYKQCSAAHAITQSMAMEGDDFCAITKGLLSSSRALEFFMLPEMTMHIYIPPRLSGQQNSVLAC